MVYYIYSHIYNFYCPFFIQEVPNFSLLSICIFQSRMSTDATYKGKSSDSIISMLFRNVSRIIKRNGSEERFLFSLKPLELLDLFD